MWIWYQREGEMWRGHAFYARGYAGHGAGVNNPDLQRARSVGPVMVGWYTIGPPEPGHGGYTLRLTPDATNDMRGDDGKPRGGFLIHGDDFDPAPNSASLGCIILPRPMRMGIWTSGDTRLEVRREMVPVASVVITPVSV